MSLKLAIAVCGSALSCGLAHAAAPTPLANPILPGPTLVPVAVDLVDFVVLPGGRPQDLAPAPDGTTDLMAVDQVGVVYRVSADGTKVTRYLDIRTLNIGLFIEPEPTGGEEGLVGLAFHPNFAGNPIQPGYGKFYIAYSAATGGGPTPDFLASASNDHEQVIREFTATNPLAASFAGTSREVLRVGHQFANHNGGVIRFNPNAAAGTPDYGALYVGFGDGGGQDDPQGNAQDRTSPLGKILRINPLQTATGKYSIPSDNPFQTYAGAGPLVWARGLRNPQQFSFEVGGAGRMAIDDIGQAQVERVYLGASGANYGWQLIEGTFATGAALGTPGGKTDVAAYALPAAASAYNFTYPVAEYDHSDDARDGKTQGAAIGSGYFYHGTAVPAFGNGYIFADLVEGKLFGIDAGNDGTPVPRPVLQGTWYYKGVAYTSLSGSPLGEGTRSDLRLGTDARGELYALLKSTGGIYRIVAH